MTPALEVRVSRRATAQVEKLSVWWAKNRPASQGAISRELEKAFALLAMQPSIGLAQPMQIYAACGGSTYQRFDTTSTIESARIPLMSWRCGIQVAAPCQAGGSESIVTCYEQIRARGPIAVTHPDVMHDLVTQEARTLVAEKRKVADLQSRRALQGQGQGQGQTLN